MRNIDILGRKRRKNRKKLRSTGATVWGGSGSGNQGFDFGQGMAVMGDPNSQDPDYLKQKDAWANQIKSQNIDEAIQGASTEEVENLYNEGKIVNTAAYKNPETGKSEIIPSTTLPEFEVNSSNLPYYDQLTETQKQNIADSKKPTDQSVIDKYGYDPAKNNPMLRSANIHGTSGYGFINPTTGQRNKSWTQSVKDDIVKPGMTVAAGALAAPALEAIGPGLWNAANTNLLGVSGTSTLDAAGLYGGYQGAKNAPGDIKKFAENPSWSNAGDVALDALGVFGGGLSAKNLLKGGKELLNKGKSLTTLNTKPPTIANLSGKLDETTTTPLRQGSLGDTAEQLIGKALSGKKNQKVVDAGNKWLDDWIKHPTTQGKISDDVAKLVKEGDETQHLLQRINVNPAHQAAGYLDEMKHYTPNVSRYSTKGHLKDLFAGKPNVHGDNYGVSYRHGLDGYKSSLNRLQQESGYKPHIELGDKSGRLGTWTSDAFGIGKGKRFSTTVHEGTHDWTTAQRLHASGKRDLINKSINRDHKWPSKTTKEYMEEPTEIHARIMQNRAMANLSPDDVVTDAGVKAMMNMNKDLKLVDEGRDDFYNMFKPGQLSNLFNKTYVAPTAVAGTGLGVLSGNNNKNQKGVSSQ